MIADLPLGRQECYCECGWQEDLVFPGEMPIEITIIVARYRSLCHVASEHGDEFKKETGHDPVASIAAYDQEIAALGVKQLFMD